MSTPTKCSLETTGSTPQETPAAIVRAIAALATAPADSFGALINEDDRDQQFQWLEARLGAEGWSDLWSSERESEVFDRLWASLSTDEDRALLGGYSDRRTAETCIGHEAAFPALNSSVVPRLKCIDSSTSRPTN